MTVVGPDAEQLPVVAPAAAAGPAVVATTAVTTAAAVVLATITAASAARIDRARDRRAAVHPRMVAPSNAF
ncbi:MAG: hypothetical protein ACYDHU_03890 [Acidimicrobiales bacterium]